MFKSIFDEHKARRAEKRQQLVEEETAIVEKLLPALTRALFEKFNAANTEMLSLQTQIKEKAQRVREEWTDYQKEVERWLIFANNLDVLTSEIGDVQTLAQSIQTDVQAIFHELNEKKD
jgi:hypothetical protein